MKRETTYQLEKDDSNFDSRLGEALNMIAFVFVHCPELAIHPKGFKRPDGTKVEEAHPHNIIFKGDRFTVETVAAWNEWVDRVLRAGRQAIQKQPPMFREGHKMALQRFLDEAEGFRIYFEDRV
jgi:hypothetical protein